MAIHELPFFQQHGSHAADMQAAMLVDPTSCGRGGYILAKALASSTAVDPCHTFFLRPPMVWEQILKMKTSPSIANKGDHSMPTLQNPRHERFAQDLAAGKSADAAYVLAGYRANWSNAASANQDIQRRVAEIQSLGAELAAITVETLIAEAELARSKNYPITRALLGGRERGATTLRDRSMLGKTDRR